MQARDVEASLREQLLEQFHDLVLARAVAAGSSGRSPAALAAAATAAELLHPILSVLPASGAAGSACLGRACAALNTQKRLKGRAIATGLQAVMQQLTAEGAHQCRRSTTLPFFACELMKRVPSLLHCNAYQGLHPERQRDDRSQRTGYTRGGAAQLCLCPHQCRCTHLT